MADITPEMLTLASIVSVKIQSCVTRFEDEGKRRKKYTAFIVELKTHGGLVWTVDRRFSQFHKINEVLKKRYAELKLFKFPPKRWFSSFATQTVEQRRRVFEVYLQELLCLQPRPHELNNFLDINAHVWGSAQVTLDPATGQPIHATGDAAGFNGQGGGAGGAGSMPQGGVYAAGGDGGARSPNGGVVGAGGGGIGAGAGAGAAPVTVVSSDFINRLRSGNVGLDDFELLRVLGKGSFGKVFLVRLIATGEVYAMKVLKKSEVVRRRQVEHTKAERRIMGGIDHPFVVALRFAFQTADKLYMVTDYCKGGELFFHLKKFRTFPEPMVRFFAAELVAALAHLHSLDIVYRDLKPENVLLDHIGHVHLTDFGLSKDEVSDPRGATTFCGTPEYLAPEMLINRKSREGYGKAVDWWSLGTLIFEMLTGWPPFYDKNLRKMCEQILKSDLHFPPGCTASPEARDLIRALLQRDPAARLGSRSGAGVNDIKAHPFFRGIDWDRIEKMAVEPPFKPRVEGDTDIGNFDAAFTSEPAVLTPPAPSDLSDIAAGMQGSEDAFADFGFVQSVDKILPGHAAAMVAAAGAGAGQHQLVDDDGGDADDAELAGFDGGGIGSGLHEADVDGDDDEEGDGGGAAGSVAPLSSGSGGGDDGASNASSSVVYDHIERPPLDPAAAAELQRHLAQLALSPTVTASLGGGGAGAVPAMQLPTASTG